MDLLVLQALAPMITGVAMALLLGVTVTVMLRIARPALSPARDEDVNLRVLRTLNIMSVTAGSLLLHLAIVLDSLAGTASLEASVLTNLGQTDFWTPMAGLAPSLSVAAFICASAGIALWARVALTSIPSRFRASGTARS